MTGNLHVFFFVFFIHMNSNYLFGYKYKGFDNSNQTWHARSIGVGGGAGSSTFCRSIHFLLKKIHKENFFREIRKRRENIKELNSEIESITYRYLCKYSFEEIHRRWTLG